MTTPDSPASPEAPQPVQKDHGRAGRDLPAAITSAVVLVAAILLSLFFWKTAFMGIVAAAVAVAVWELHRGLSAKDIDIPEQPLMAGASSWSSSPTSGAPRRSSPPPRSPRW